MIEEPLLAELYVSFSDVVGGRVVDWYRFSCSADSATAPNGLPNFDPCFLFNDFFRMS